MKKIILMLVMLCSMFWENEIKSFAATTSENLSITVPANIEIEFNEDGSNEVSSFLVENPNPLSINLNCIQVKEYNNWKLVNRDSAIPVDTKEFILKFEGQIMEAGENLTDITISEYSEKELGIEIERGAWSANKEKESALGLEFTYELIKKEFQITFDGNGYTTELQPIRAFNGDEVTLPVLERSDYEFEGWQDEDGNIYSNEFIMPIGNITLTAKWKELPKTAYAIYSEDDNSLVFTRSASVISVGDIYNGKTVTKAYTGFESRTYSSAMYVPWYSNREKITSVIFEESIKPQSTSYWFYYFRNCNTMDLGKLDMSNVTKTTYMLNSAGYYSDNLQITGLEEWDVSKVTDMSNMCRSMGYNSKEFILDLSKWNTSEVTNMSSMFAYAGNSSDVFEIKGLEQWNTSKVTQLQSTFAYSGEYADIYEIDLSSWDVSKVTTMNSLFSNAGQFATEWSVGNLSEWNVQNVLQMNGMFNSAGYFVDVFDIGDLGEWNVSNVIDLEYMFYNAGSSCTSFHIGNLENWDVSNVTDMQSMFSGTAVNAEWYLDCSNWDVSNVSSYDNFNKDTDSKVISPNFGV